jgi:hypothetical protein
LESPAEPAAATQADRSGTNRKRRRESSSIRSRVPVPRKKEEVRERREPSMRRSVCGVGGIGLLGLQSERERIPRTGAVPPVPAPGRANPRRGGEGVGIICRFGACLALLNLKRPQGGAPGKEGSGREGEERERLRPSPTPPDSSTSPRFTGRNVSTANGPWSDCLGPFVFFPSREERNENERMHGTCGASRWFLVKKKRKKQLSSTGVCGHKAKANH